jgi:hypothetical protein
LSHATGDGPYADVVKVREPVARPLDVVAVELLLSASQAFLVGVLMYLAIGVWDDQGLGQGPVAIILALLGLAVGGAWAYWLMGGVGWPLAAANVPVAMFLGFALVLGWSGSDLFVVTGVPLLLATMAAVFGIVGGVFVESPRRWPWDQRQRPRAGTTVPHVSPTTRKVIAAVPRGLPRRVPPPPPSSELASRIEQSTPAGPASSGAVGNPYLDAPNQSKAPPAGGPLAGPGSPSPSGDASSLEPDTLEAADVVRAMPTKPLSSGAAGAVTDGRADGAAAESGAIELPTSIEPRAQRSPWAWAAPPEWNRDEDDEATTGRPARRA